MISCSGFRNSRIPFQNFGIMSRPKSVCFCCSKDTYMTSCYLFCPSTIMRDHLIIFNFSKIAVSNLTNFGIHNIYRWETQNCKMYGHCLPRPASSLGSEANNYTIRKKLTRTIFLKIMIGAGLCFHI